jgi:hypothetical protein
LRFLSVLNDLHKHANNRHPYIYVFLWEDTTHIGASCQLCTCSL